MKKLSLLGMALLMCLSIAACGQNQSSENNTEENETSTSGGVENNEDNSENQQEEANSDQVDNQNSENTAKDRQENQQPDSNNSSEKSDVKVGNKEWPTADFISSDMKYDGGGEIVATEYVTEGENENSHMIWCIYYSGTSLDDVKNYVNKLKNAGFKYYGILNDKEPEVKFEDGLYYWMGESSENKKSAMVYLCEEPDTYKNPENNEEKSFNLVIQLCNTTISELFK